MRPSLFKGGDESVITGTRIHPVWSLDQNAWVELGHLEVGETLLGADGPTKVQCLTFLSANQPVYNLEVFGEHVYRVGNSGVLCHNTGDGVCTFVLKPVAPKGGFGSFDALKRALGPAGEGRHWHHIVEQSKIGQFAADAIHHVDNVISVLAPIHHKITGFYNSIQDFTGGKTVREWLNGQSFEFQRDFGMDILRRFGAL